MHYISYIINKSDKIKVFTTINFYKNLYDDILLDKIIEDIYNKEFQNNSYIKSIDVIINDIKLCECIFENNRIIFSSTIFNFKLYLNNIYICQILNNEIVNIYDNKKNKYDINLYYNYYKREYRSIIANNFLSNVKIILKEV